VWAGGFDGSVWPRAASTRHSVMQRQFFAYKQSQTFLGCAVVWHHDV
jgi:hypothetical protein